MPDPHTHPPHPRLASMHRAGLLTAAGVTLVLALVLGFFILRGMRERTPAAPQAQGASPELSGAQTAPGAQGSLGQGRGFFVQFVDRKDLARIAGEITADRSTPLANFRYELIEPRGWVFLRDGRTVAVRARRGIITLPEGGSQPSDGQLEGDVLVQLFPATPEGTRPDPQTQASAADFTTSRLLVDWTLGEVEVPEAFGVTSPTFDVAGVGLTASFTPDTQRLLSAFIQRTDRAILRPAPRQQNTAAPSPGQAAPAPASVASAPEAPAPAAAPQTPEPPVSLEYTLRATGDVRVEGRGVVATAQSLDIAARLVDGRIPDRTVAPRTASATAPSREPPAEGSASSSTAAAPARIRPARFQQRDPADAAARQAAPPPAPTTTTETAPPDAAPDTAPQAHDTAPDQAADADAFTLAFTGPLEVRLAESPLPELAADDLHVVLSSPAAAGVRVTQSDEGVEVLGTRLAYAATTQVATLEGIDMPRGASIESAGAGTLLGRELRLDLASGLVRILSAGQAWAHADEGEPARMTWSEQAQFTLLQRDGATTSRLLAAAFVGEVRAQSEAGSFGAHQVDAVFASDTEAPGAGDASVLRSVTLLGQASAADLSGGTLSATRLRVEFESEPQDVTRVRAVLVEANGSARASYLGDTLEADQVTAQLAPRTSDQPTTPSEPPATLPAVTAAEVVHLLASGAARVSRADGLTAQADSITASPPTQAAILLGTAATPARIETFDGSVQGGRIVLDGLARTALIDGPGELTGRLAPRGSASETNPDTGADANQDQASPLDDTAPDERDGLLRATWTGSARFDDSAGTALLSGSVQGEVTQRDDRSLSQDRVVSDSLSVEFSPADALPSGSATAPGILDGAAGTRQVRRAVAQGSAAAPARVTMRRFLPDDPQRLLQLAYLEGATIDVRPEEGTLAVPGAGRLLVRDTAPIEAPAAEPAQPDAAQPDALAQATAGGDSLFTWQQRLDFDQFAGRAVLTGDVTLRHRAKGQAGVSELEGGRLVATFVQSVEGADVVTPDGDRPSTGLRDAEVDGGVWVRASGRELSAARVMLDAQANIVQAFASVGAGASTPVQIASPGSPPITAAMVRWELSTDRVEVLDPGAFEAPR